MDGLLRELLIFWWGVWGIEGAFDLLVGGGFEGVFGLLVVRLAFEGACDLLVGGWLLEELLSFWWGWGAFEGAVGLLAGVGVRLFSYLGRRVVAGRLLWPAGRS